MKKDEKEKKYLKIILKKCLKSNKCSRLYQLHHTQKVIKQTTPPLPTSPSHPNHNTTHHKIQTRQRITEYKLKP